MVAPRPYVSALWEHAPEDLHQRLEAAIAQGVQACPTTPKVFFRADDIGVPSHLFTAMIEAFASCSAPLGLAVVPAWFSPKRWGAIQQLTGKQPHLWCWHQHGWRHVNHQTEGRKYEFGSSRSKAGKHNDLARGQIKLHSILGSQFTPLFTPPWNRVDYDTLESLRELGFMGISRTVGAKPAAPEGLPDIPINVDLHTRREATPEEGWNAFLAELQRALASGHCGVMLHHQRMNEAAVSFLPQLLTTLAAQSGLSLVSMADMVL